MCWTGTFSSSPETCLPINCSVPACVSRRKRMCLRRVHLFVCVCVCECARACGECVWAVHLLSLSAVGGQTCRPVDLRRCAESRLPATCARLLIFYFLLFLLLFFFFALTAFVHCTFRSHCRASHLVSRAHEQQQWRLRLSQVERKIGWYLWTNVIIVTGWCMSSAFQSPSFSPTPFFFPLFSLSCLLKIYICDKM